MKIKASTVSIMLPTIMIQRIIFCKAENRPRVDTSFEK